MKKALCLFLTCAALFWASGTAVSAQEGRTVKVAFPIQEGLTDLDEYGQYTGYTYEYLEEIAQYTGWDYEFVQAPGSTDQSLTTLMERVRDGQIDLMGGMLYSEDSDQSFDYSSHSYGAVETVLQAPLEQAQNVVINSQVEQTLRVAVVKVGGRMTQELEDYCRMNLITPVYVECANEEELIAAVREGRADVLLNTSLNSLPGVRTVARFASKPFYFVTADGANQELMDELNGAMRDIDQTDPYFITALYEKYFPPADSELMLSQAEKRYVEAAGPLRVGVLKNRPPLQYVDEESGACQGISIGLLHYISQETGLRFEFVLAEGEDALLELTRSGQIDLVAGMAYQYGLARQRQVSMTRPFLSSQYLLMMRETGEEESIKGKRLALSKAFSEHERFLGQVTRYDDVDACIRAVVDGDADYTYVDSYTAQYYINKPEFQGLKLVPQTYEPGRFCFGIVKPGRRELLSIFNKAIVTISEVDLQGIINQNTIVRQPFSIAAYVRGNPVQSIAVIAAVSLSVIAVLLYFLRQRARMSKKSALELKKHYRVCALMNEYFFEYNHRTGDMLVSIPPEKGEGQPELVQYDFSVHRGNEERQAQCKGFLEVILSQQDGVAEARLLCEDGQWHWLQFAMETIYDGDKPAFVVGKINIIDQEKREKDTLLEKAELDSLTRLYNAEAGKSYICQALEELGQGETGALILLDVDDFKTVNDTYGHLKGDWALEQVANMLRDSFRKDDIVGRPGGDEFAVYLKSATDQKFLESRCAALCVKARGISVAEDRVLTISVGAALSSWGDDYSSLYQKVDRALYKAKERGRDQYCLAGEDSED